MAYVCNRLVTGAHADLEVLNSLANLDDYTSTFVAGAFRAECRHGWKVPIVAHEVDVGQTETGGIQFDQYIVRTCIRTLVLGVIA